MNGDTYFVRPLSEFPSKADPPLIYQFSFEYQAPSPRQSSLDVY
jgi:hypothetical protein